MSAGQADARRWQVTRPYMGGISLTTEYSARELHLFWGYADWCTDFSRIEGLNAGEKYTDAMGWAWERIA